MQILRSIVYFCLYASLLGQSVLLSAQTPTTREYQVKAIFLFNFSQFVEWPQEAFPEEQSPLVIGILGDDPFGQFLEETVLDEKINGHPLVVKRYRQVDEIKTCHILFISSTETPRMGKVLADLKDKSILTVSEASSFIRHGGMIRFLTENNKIRLQINPKAVRAANLTISSKLLKLAEIVAP